MVISRPHTARKRLSICFRHARAGAWNSYWPCPEYLRRIVKPKAVFGTHTSLTTEQHSWLVPTPNGQSVRYSLLGRNRTTFCRPQRLECSIEQHSDRKSVVEAKNE